jgi:hypothetical protein
MELFLRQGFNETTIAGRRHDLAAAVEARPAGESPWEALRRALDEPLAALNTDGGRALARATKVATGM